MVNVIEELDPFKNNIKIGCVTYGNIADVNFGLDTFDNLSDMTRAVRDIPYKDQNTNTSAGIYAMQHEVLREDRGRRSNAPSLGKILA